MKISLIAVGALFWVSHFLIPAYAIELCEPRDYYNLANSTKCSIQYNEEENKSDSRERVLEILKTYPYEQKDQFSELLKKKIDFVGNYITQQQGQSQTEKVKSNMSKLEQTKQVLSEQLGAVNAATKDNWESVRDRARKALDESAKRLYEIE